MIRLLEDRTKAWLGSAGFRVPEGEAVSTPEGAVAAAVRLGSATMVKALVPSGRRGKAAAVSIALTADEAGVSARELLGRVIDGYAVASVYIERRIAIASELYVAFLFDHNGPCVVVSARGGVDIEATAAADEGALVRRGIDVRHGLPPWLALEMWHRAGLRGTILRDLGAITSRLYAAFRDGDAELLEINPLAVDGEGTLWLVGAMAAIDASALARHPEWQDVDSQPAPGGAANPREQRVAAVDRSLPGGECRYVELDGDIGLLVGGGGAGLYQHDRMLAMGGRPANHSVTPPTGTDRRKLKTVIEAIFDNPRTRGLLVGFNFAQMARADIRVATLLEVIDERALDTARLPIVIRLFGAGEEEARARVAGRPGIHYVPRETSLDDAIDLIVALTAHAAPSHAA
jgi:succinyl-CoA synthetase beta subunit